MQSRVGPASVLALCSESLSALLAVAILAPLVVLLAGAARIPAAEPGVPPAPQLLPDDTFFLISVPDLRQAGTALAHSPHGQFWKDPAMKPFADKLAGRLKEEILAPLEREWQFRGEDWQPLLQGQFTFALTAPGPGATSSTALLLLDTGGRVAPLASNLAALRKQWVDAGRRIRAERIRDVEFSVLLATAGDVPQGVRDALSPARFYLDPTGGNAPPERAAPPPRAAGTEAPGELFVGQSGGLLLVATAARPLERVLARLAGSQPPVLADVPAFAADFNASLREAPFGAWLRPDAVMPLLGAPANPASVPAHLTEGAPENAAFVPVHLADLLRALGLASARSAAFSLRETPEGWLFQCRLTAPETARQGILAALGGPAGETTPPPLVPADALEFHRWRVSGPRAFACLQAAAASLSPHFQRTFNFLLDSAQDATRLEQPGYDLRQALESSLGDDLLWLRRLRPDAAAELDAQRTLVLLSSPQPEHLLGALHSVFVLLPQEDSGRIPRDFLGRKVYSVPLPPTPDQKGELRSPGILHYAAGASQVALATDAALLEEYLRGPATPARSLNALAGLPQAAQRVVEPGTFAFGVLNRSTTARAALATLKRQTNSVAGFAALSPLPGFLVESLAETTGLGAWLDGSTLPAFDPLARHFHFTVYSFTATSEAIIFKLFAPRPPPAKTD